MRIAFRMGCLAPPPLRPTLAGLFWLLAVIALLATAINYGNNVIFAMAFLLLSIWLQAAWRCHHHLARITWLAHTPAATFVGDCMRIEGRINHALPSAEVWLADDACRGNPFPVDHAGEAQCSLDLPAPTRGEHTLDYLRLASSWPLGLWQSQRRLPAMTVMVYPRPNGTSPLPGSNPTRAHRQAASGDFQDLLSYTPGDPPRRINWRVFARRDELLVNRFDGDRGGRALWLDFADCAGDTEARLSQLANWVLGAEHAGQEYGLRLPGAHVPPGIGRHQRGECLRRLALFRQPEPTTSAKP